MVDKPLNFVGIIKDLIGNEVFVSRLRELGFVRGEQILIRGISPFGGPVMVEIRGAVVALRRNEAECILV